MTVARVLAALAGIAAVLGAWDGLVAVEAIRFPRAAAGLLARGMAEALGGGHSVRGAVAAAAGELDGPAARELGAAASSLAIGEPTETVLERLRRRAACGSFDTIVAAVLIQRDAGGDLAGLLRGVARAQEDTGRLEQDARAATAQARFTGTLVCALPLLAALLAELASPGYLASLLGAPLSAVLAVAAVGFQVAALVAIRRLARVRA